MGLYMALRFGVIMSILLLFSKTLYHVVILFYYRKAHKIGCLGGPVH